MPRSTDTRLKILSTASKLFQIQGYHGTGIQQIIKESGCPKGSLYYYFPEGKEQLAEEAINRLLELAFIELERFFPPSEHIIDSLEHYFSILTNFDFDFDHEGFPLALMALETSHMSERLRLACKEAYEAILQFWERKFIESGWPQKEAEEISFIMFTMMEGSSIFAITNKSNEPLKKISESFMKIVRSKQRELTDIE